METENTNENIITPEEEKKNESPETSPTGEQLSELKSETEDVMNLNKSIIEETEKIKDPEIRKEETDKFDQIKSDLDQFIKEFEEILRLVENSENIQSADSIEDLQQNFQNILAFIEKSIPHELEKENSEDSNEYLKQVAERLKEYKNKIWEEKEKEFKAYTKEYTNNLGLEKGHEDIDPEEKKAIYAEKQENLIKEIETNFNSPEMANKRAKYAEVINTEKDIFNMTDQKKIDAVNDYYYSLGKIYQDCANFMKYNYLNSGILNEKNLIENQHIGSIITIEKLEATSEVLQKGIENLNEEEKRDISKYTKNLEKIKGAMKVGLVMGIFAIMAIFNGERMDSFMERITGKKVPAWAKSKKESAK
jgi:hypothetical protein